MPFTSVVLPEPSSPRKSRSIGGSKPPASSRPRAMVSSGLAVVNSCGMNLSEISIAARCSQLRRGPAARTQADEALVRFRFEGHAQGLVVLVSHGNEAESLEHFSGSRAHQV